jgi:hypothetical protein
MSQLAQVNFGAVVVGASGWLGEGVGQRAGWLGRAD